MEKTVLVELTSKQIKLAEGIVLFVLFVSLLAGFGLLSIMAGVSVRRVEDITEALWGAKVSQYGQRIKSEDLRQN